MITHAVIPVAGFGTRMLPLSKSVPKELLPLGNRPVIEYVVEEAIAAGIRHIIFVTHAQKQAIENHFDINAELDYQLRQKGKDTLADSLNWLPSDVRISTVRQGRALGLGHAVLQAKTIIGQSAFAVLLPDVVLSPYHTDYYQDNLAKMIYHFNKTGRSQILVETVRDEDVHKYGIAKLANHADMPDGKRLSCEVEPLAVQGFVEKPDINHAPSNLAIVGRYVFDASIFQYLEMTQPSVGGEIQLTDAIDALIEKFGVDVLPMVGRSHDAGDMTSYLNTFVEFANHQLNADEINHKQPKQ